MHRVALTDPAPRQSMAFFHMANWDATIEPLPACVAPGGQPRYEPVQAGSWLMKKFQATVATTATSDGEGARGGCATD